jgi:DUF4097 and DUF4098 domain-containing protein YvlB
MKRALLAAVAAAALGLTGCNDGNFGYHYRESVDISKPFAASGRLTLENTNGTIHVSTWNETRVRIEAVKAAGSESALRRLEVVVEGEGERVDVRTRMPRGHWFGSGGKVDYTVTVPRSARVSLRNVNGRIEISDVGGGVEARNVNGTVDAEDVGGEVQAETVNGSVQVSIARVDPASRSRIAATNGTVRLSLPANVAADVEASTVNGAVHCDFEVTGGKVSRRKVEGRIGPGGARFELRTVNGSANIDRGLSSTAATADNRPEAEATRSTAR